MSYCRWSSDDFRCDLYIYDDVRGGVTIHVAGRRHAIDDSALPPPVSVYDIDRWVARHEIVIGLIHEAPLVDIGLPHDGEDFYGLTYEAAAAKVRELIACGYRCDPAVADELDADARAAAAVPQRTDGRPSQRPAARPRGGQPYE